jgi:hypothetical protein
MYCTAVHFVFRYWTTQGSYCNVLCCTVLFNLAFQCIMKCCTVMYWVVTYLAECRGASLWVAGRKGAPRVCRSHAGLRQSERERNGESESERGREKEGKREREQDREGEKEPIRGRGYNGYEGCAIKTHKRAQYDKKR